MQLVSVEKFTVTTRTVKTVHWYMSKFCVLPLQISIVEVSLFIQFWW